MEFDDDFNSIIICEWYESFLLYLNSAYYFANAPRYFKKEKFIDVDYL